MIGRRLVRAGVALVAIASVTALAGCNEGNGRETQDFNQSFRSGKRTSSVQVGEGAKIPADFPTSAVPLPVEGALQAVVAGSDPPNKFFTLTYGLGGRSGVAAGTDYARRLERAGFDIRNETRETGTDTGFATFDAISDRWDVFVVSGKAARRERPALSIQVSTHGTLGGISDQTIFDPQGNGSGTSSTTAPVTDDLGQ